MKKILLNNIFYIKFNSKNLINVILKEILSNKILMLAWFNYNNIINIIINKSNLTFFSRKKLNFWLKGKISKNLQFFKNFFLDCDLDCLLILLFQNYKISCHEFYKNCFYNKF